MVGFNPDLKVHLSHTEHALAGAASGAVSRLLCQPLDVLKIRFQLQVDPIRKGSQSKYWGLQHAVRRIVAEEGMRALWKGHIPAQILSVTYGVAQYTSFEAFTKTAWYIIPESLTTEWRPVTHTLCGALSASVATIVVQPSDVLRTRFVAQGEPKIYKSISEALWSIVRHEGVRGLYKGWTPALAQIGPQMGLQFGLYALFTQTWDSMLGTAKDKIPGTIESLVCGSGAGVASKMIIYPFDVVKKRLQVQGFEKARESFGTVRKYNGLGHCLMCIIKEEGTRGLYKGLSPSLIKAGAVAGCNFCVYDQIMRVMLWSHR